MSRILVIDDEDVVRDLIAEILERAGHDVVAAASADAGLAAAHDVSLVVSDIVMPGVSGVELVERLHELRPGVPVVLVTGAVTEETVQRAIAAGAAAVVAKPFSHAELVRTVADALERA